MAVFGTGCDVRFKKGGRALVVPSIKLAWWMFQSSHVAGLVDRHRLQDTSFASTLAVQHRASLVPAAHAALWVSPPLTFSTGVNSGGIPGWLFQDYQSSMAVSMLQLVVTRRVWPQYPVCGWV